MDTQTDKQSERQTDKLQRSVSVASVESNLTSSNSDQHASNINVRAAFIHVLGDFCQSVGVLIAAIVIKTVGVREAFMQILD